MKTPPLNRESAPAGLLLIADFIARVPERATDILERERQKRDLTLLSIHQLKHAYSWNPKRTVWIALLIGFTIFTSLWSLSTTLGMFSSSGQSLTGTMNELSTLGIELPPNIASQFGGVASAADSMPKISVGDSLLISIVCMVLFGVIRYLFAIPNMHRLKALDEEELRVEEEMKTLTDWSTEAMNKGSKVLSVSKSN